MKNFVKSTLYLNSNSFNKNVTFMNGDLAVQFHSVEKLKDSHQKNFPSIQSFRISLV